MFEFKFCHGNFELYSDEKKCCLVTFSIEFFYRRFWFYETLWMYEIAKAASKYGITHRFQTQYAKLAKVVILDACAMIQKTM